MFPVDGFGNERRFRAAWDAVEIVRPVRYSLFTFGASDLPYFLVLSGLGADKTVSITKGEVKITVIASGFAEPGSSNQRRSSGTFGTTSSPLSASASAAMDDDQPRGKIYNTLQSLTRDVKPISEKYEPKVEAKPIEIKKEEDKPIEPTAASTSGDDEEDKWGAVPAFLRKRK